MKTLFGASDHGAEFVERKGASVQAAAILPEDHGSRRGEFHQQGHGEQKRAQHDDRGERDRDIDEALGKEQHFVVRRGIKGEQRRIAESFERELAVDVREKVHRKPAADALFVTPQEDFFQSRKTV